MDIDDPKQSSPQPIQPSTRIQELLQIDRDVSTCLKNASHILTLLANQTTATTTHTTLEQAQTELSHTSAAFFETLSSIEVRLRRQVYALEEAGLVQPGTRADAADAGRLVDEGASRRGGAGVLDASWLRARAEDRAGREIKREALGKMLDFLDGTGVETKTEERNLEAV